jgi:hypothetical protein
VAVQNAYLRTPLRFEPGAKDTFAARGIGYAVSLAGGNATLTLRTANADTATLEMRLAGGRANAPASTRRPLTGRSNHLIGSNPALWKTGVQSYGEVRYHDVYPGIDLAYYGNQQQLEYDFIVSPGTSPELIAFEIDGARRVSVDRHGNLQIETDAGTLTHRAPVLYQDVGGTRRAIAGNYVVRDDRHVAFEVGPYDSRHTLVIDPVLSYATYLGGASYERLHAVAIDAAGHVVVAGETYSANFPTASALQPQIGGFGDAFIAKLTPAGDSLVFATYLGGIQGDSATGVDIDASSAIYVTGTTFSWNFPTMNGVQPNNNGQSDAFVAKLDAGGNLVYSTLLGGMLEEYATGIAVDAFGRAHIAGSTMSADFPMTSPIQPSLGGSPVFRTDNGGDTWTGLGSGLRTNGVRAFAIDPAAPDTVYAAGELGGVFKSSDAGATWLATGSEISYWQVNALVVAGGSSAVYAATPGGIYRSTDGGDTWAFVLSGWGTSLVASTESPSVVYAGLGGNGFPVGVFKSVDGGDTWTDTGLTDPVSTVAISGSRLYAATWAGVSTSLSGEGWVPANAGLSSQPSALVADAGNPAVAYAATFEGLFKTTTGGASWDVVPILAGVPIASVAISASDPATLMVSVLWGGTAISNDGGENWRLTHSEAAVFFAMAIHPSSPGVAYLGGMLSRDAFVATIGADGNTLEFSSYFGGSGHERATDIAVDANGARYVVGETNSSDLPLSNARQTIFGGLQDAFAARIGPEGLTYSTYLGGSGFEPGPKLALDASGRAHLAGLTWSGDFPTANAVQPQLRGGYVDLFVSVLTPNGAFVYSTYLGGSGYETDWSQTLGPDISVSASGDTYVTGTTMSHDFPTTADAFQPAHGGGSNDAFLTRLDTAGRPQYSTYLGGSGDDYGRSVAPGSGTGVAVAGYTTSANFPTHNAMQPVAAGTDEAFIAHITDENEPSDTEAPVTTVALAGTEGQAGWYRSGVSVTLTATDNDGGSGVAAIYYRLNGGTLQTYNGPFTISTQGVTYLTAHAADAAGNVEAPSPSTIVKVDTTAPAVLVTSPQAREYLYDRTLSVSVSVSETLSGLSAPVVVTVDGVVLAGSVLDMSTLALGAHTLTAAASDLAGNAAATSVVFRVVAELDTVINVPAEAATIQAAIDAADNGFTVLVAPGTYRESIDFRGKAITVISQAGPGQTIIDAGGAGSVVTFRSGETRAAVLSGFTVRGGVEHSGGGISIASSSPTIRGNVVTGNSGCTGVGIYSSFSSPLIQANRITGNAIAGCTGGWGIGIYVGGNSAAEILENEITDNTGAAATGGGLALFAAGSAVVRGNVIAGNGTSGAAGCGWGGGLATANFSQATIAGNRITGNRACAGGGVYWLGSGGSNVFVNNTIADNEADSWPGMFASGFDARNQLHNNIISARIGPALQCQNGTGLSQPFLSSNDIFSGQGPAYGGSCADQTGLNGNISADPLFLDAAAGDYRVSMTSPVVDSGNDAAPALPGLDITGQPRVVDGNADGIARVDIGALEYRNRAPVVDAGADLTVPVGADCLGAITLNASGSDADGDALTFTWSGAATGSGTSLPLALPAGTYVFMVTAEDGNGGRTSDSVTVTVVDTAPPVISAVTATPSVIERPNHDMVPIVVSVSATDGCGAVDCRIVSVSSNEPAENDWQITGNLTVNVRAERAGKGSGRIYTITVACKDEAGNVASSTVTVTVPR